jgi:hypothetical protein
VAEALHPKASHTYYKILNVLTGFSDITSARLATLEEAVGVRAGGSASEHVGSSSSPHAAAGPSSARGHCGLLEAVSLLRTRLSGLEDAMGSAAGDLQQVRRLGGPLPPDAQWSTVGLACPREA